jgi:hypothetical protein
MLSTNQAAPAAAPVPVASALAAGAPTAAPEYYLQDSRSLTGDNLMFWAEGGGYSSNLALAQLYSEDEAFSQNDCRSTDIPWPADYVSARTRLVVDMQYIKATDITPEEHADCDQFYLQQSGYVGNDILLVARAGGQTTDLGLARVFTRDEMLTGPVQQLRAIPWPTTYLDNKSRPAVDYKKVNLKAALKGVARALKRERKHVERYRCCGCGVFMTAANYYGNACRCGTENRP